MRYLKDKPIKKEEISSDSLLELLYHNVEEFNRLRRLDLDFVPKFQGANLSNADLSNADLSNADLSNADLFHADLSNANLSNADLSNAT